MTLKKIAIVGRPNVGKSALFNAISKKRLAIVDEQEGVTRDRLYTRAELFGFPFEIIDTGGIEVHSKAAFAAEIKQQAEVAICEADSIIMVVDATAPVLALDDEVAKILHRSKKPITLAVNKIDAVNPIEALPRFSSLGFTSIIGVSAAHGLNITELLESALKSFDKTKIPEVGPEVTKVAICGRPNVGKSLLFNNLLGHERSIVSPLAGTTRDSIDTKIIYDGEEFLFIDTAGIRRRHKERDVVEKFAFQRSQEAIERADIVLLVVDASTGITTEEKKLARQIYDEGKGCIVLLNKWDLVEGFRMEHCLKALNQEIPFLEHCPKIIISAKTERNLEKIFPTIKQVRTSFTQRVTTGQLNRGLVKAMQLYHPPAIQGRRLRIYYLSQIGTEPPRFVLFVNSPDLMEGGYKRYLINYLRKEFEFNGVPLILDLKGKTQRRKKESHVPVARRSHDRDLHATAAADSDSDEQ